MNDLHGNSKYQTFYCGMIPKMMSDGQSIVEVAAQFKVDRKTILRWIKTYPDFKEAVDLGLTLSQAWWEEQGRINLNDSSFNYPGWFKQMKNKWFEDWKDQHEIVHTDGLADRLREAKKRRRELKEDDGE